MCRSIKVLRTLSGEPANDPKETEIREAALQFVRKISGYRKPSQANIQPFETAIEEVAAASRKLLSTLKPVSLKTGRPPETATNL